ncbi:reverse transcriptase domain, reverse transcriptase zinc-binding domain protein, partial [Tanacetum coccineum]
MKRMSAWNGVVDRFKSRLSEWKAKAMSFGGRLTLVKAVHGSLPLYYFSMFRVPLSVITALERVQKNFFWGGLGGGNKIAWVKWIGVESDTLWCKVIKSIYDVDGGWGSVGGTRLVGGGVWVDIIRVGKQLDELDGGFENQFAKKVGDGLHMSFWNDKWVGDVAFRDRFVRLYRMESNKEAKVGHKGSWVNGEWEWCWEWSRVPRGRTVGELEELEATLADVRLKQFNEDSWAWKLDAKVNVFVWRALNGRLPVRVELDKKGIDLDTLLCLGCDNVVESLDHCLVLCENVINVWDMIFAWWGVGLTDVFTADVFILPSKSELTSEVLKPELSTPILL